MLKKITIAIFCLSISILVGCSSATTNDANSSTTNTDPANLPKGIETKPIEPDGKMTPGIPDPNDAKVQELPKGETPTPGIPDPATIGKTPVPKGATPTPGIPSPEELKKMRERKIDPNDVNKSTKGSKSVSDDTTSPIDRKRRAGKPPE